MPEPYLLHVNSRPVNEVGVDDALWEKWYTTEHVRNDETASRRTD